LSTYEIYCRENDGGSCPGVKSEISCYRAIIKPTENIDGPIDFAAMVPLQLEKSLDILNKVKVLIVGGGRMNQSLIKKLQSVSTRVYETYGMTETLTHVAIKPLNGPNKSDVFTALEGVRFETDERNCLVVNVPKVNPDPVVTNDIVERINETSFRWLGRFDNIINSGGVKIIPEEVEVKLTSVIRNRRFLLPAFPMNHWERKWC